MIAYFLRHGQADHNVTHLLNDFPDKEIHLTELGKKQATEASEKLKEENIELIFASEFPRAKETAEIVNKYHNVQIKIDKRLNDIISGMEGRPVEEWLETVKEDRYNAKAPGGESFQDLKKRIIPFLNELKLLDYKIVLIVSHGDPLMAIRGHLNKISDQEALKNYVQTGEILKFNI